jgi:hypothetical protein
VSYNSLTVVGSGTKIPATAVIIPSGERGIGGDDVRLERYGRNVTVTNFEDLSGEAWAASGITVGTTAVEIFGPHLNPLPRSTKVIVKNLGAANVFISHQAAFTDEDCFTLEAAGNAGDQVELPLLHNVSIYARSSSGSQSVRLIIL